jgi:hypothetical protein
MAAGPAKNFWSVDVYDTQTRSLLQTDNPYPSVMSLGDTVAANHDGSHTIWVRAAVTRRAREQLDPNHPRQELVSDTPPVWAASAMVRQDLAAVRRHTDLTPAGTAMRLLGPRARIRTQERPCGGPSAPQVGFTAVVGTSPLGLLVRTSGANSVRKVDELFAFAGLAVTLVSGCFEGGIGLPEQRRYRDGG